MKPQLSADEIALFREPQIAHVATINADGTPLLTPLWVDSDGEFVFFNTTKKSTAAQNLQRNNHVTLSVVDKRNNFRRCVLEGTAELIEDGAVAHFNKISQKYVAHHGYRHRLLDDERVIGKIHITKFVQRSQGPTSGF